MSPPSVPLSFRFSLILAFSLLITLFLGVMVFFEMVGLPWTGSKGKFEITRVKTLDDMELVSGLMSQRISAWFKESRGDVDALARSPLFSGALDNEDARSAPVLSAELSAFLAGQSGFAAIGVFNPQDGRQVAGAGDFSRVKGLAEIGIGKDRLAQLTVPGYSETINLFGQADGQTFVRVCRQIFSPDDPHYLTGLLVADSNVGLALVQLVWAICGELSPDWTCIIASGAVDHVIQISKTRTGADPRPIFLPVAEVFPPISMALSGIEGPYEGPDTDGTAVLAFHRQVKIDSGIAMALVLKINRDLAQRPAREDLSRQLYLWFFLLAGVIALGIGVANQISLPIKDLVGVARRIEAGDLTARAKGKGNSEIGELAGVFNGMVVRLEDWNHDLERQVQNRTHELRLLTIRQEAILSAVPDIIIEVDMNKIFTWANEAGYDFYGKDVIGKEAADFFVGEQTTYQTVQPLFAGAEEPIYVESWQRRRDGQTRLLAWWCKALIDEEGRVTGVLSTARDITEQRRVEERNVQALREKEALLREIYHRTKNTLQVIQGMLVLQAAEHPASVEFQNLVSVTEQRIMAISLVHQMLYRSQDLSMVSIRDYVQELAGLIIQSTNRTDVTLDLAVEERNCPIDIVIPLGLILNELMSNSLKHAWPDGRRGAISITMTTPAPGRGLFCYADDGVGVPAGFDFRGQSGLGLKLVHSIGEQQLRGRVEMRVQAGIRCELDFPIDGEATRV